MDIGSLIASAVAQMVLWETRHISSSKALEDAREEVYLEATGPQGQALASPRAVVARQKVARLQSLVDICKKFIDSSREQRDSAIAVLESSSRKVQST